MRFNFSAWFFTFMHQATSMTTGTDYKICVDLDGEETQRFELQIGSATRVEAIASRLEAIA